jgi:hypothetical protein
MAAASLSCSEGYNRSAMFDFISTEFNRSLSETVAWCASQPLTADVAESDAIRHRRALFEESGRLMQQAYERVNRSWFRRNVLKTKEWRRAAMLSKEADPLSLAQLQSQLRTPTLRPAFALDEFGSDMSWAEAVAEVVAKRSQLVSLTSPPEHGAAEAGGRLLLYVPSENLADGAAQYSSNGFFDVNNVPPWDIWVAFSERTLVSWVPTALVELTQKGIDVNPEGCIRWAD